MNAEKTKTLPLSALVRRLEHKEHYEGVSALLAGGLLAYVRERLNDGSRIELRRFGTFGVRRRSAMNASHPRTGEKVVLKPCRLPYFRPGSILLEKIRRCVDQGEQS